MGWMDLNEYVLIEESTLATVLYMASVLRARPRSIDGYIDYFGDRVLHRAAVRRARA